jgi:tRNA (cytidine/uridine-2'-O-)-methyltransferase
MFHVVLFEPEIPPNTGNIIRLCANAGVHLHLIRPLGFNLSEKSLQRAGLDYIELANVKEWDSLTECWNSVSPPRWFAMSTKAQHSYAQIRFQAGDAFLFGPESRGLPASILESCPAAHRLRIPMRANNRSINLSNSVSIVLYEAWRQLDFEGGR